MYELGLQVCVILIVLVITLCKQSIVVCHSYNNVLKVLRCLVRKHSIFVSAWVFPCFSESNFIAACIVQVCIHCSVSPILLLPA